MSARLAPAKQAADGSPFILKLIRKCQKYDIEYDLMTRLNYSDLLALVIEYDIDQLEEYFKQREKQRQEANGIEVHEASNEDILKQFPGKG